MMFRDKTERENIAKFISQFIASLLQALPERGIFFLNRQGHFQESPQDWLERVKSELIYRLKKESWLKKENFIELIDQLSLKENFKILCQVKLGLDRFAWPLETMAIQDKNLQREIIPPCFSLLGSEEERFYLQFTLAFFDSLAALILRESLKINTSWLWPEWDMLGKKVSSLCSQKKDELEKAWLSELEEKEKLNFYLLINKIDDFFHNFLNELASFIAEEQRLSLKLNELLKRLEEVTDKDEIYMALKEKIEPPQGIVTQVAASSFYPTLVLLLYPKIDVASGLPYLASLIISLFNDSRCVDYLLYALQRFPLSWTKIRENLIYTLGNWQEERAVPLLIDLLKQPDYLHERQDSTINFCPLREQKEEAIWALGKIGLPALKAIEVLEPYADHPSIRLKTCLAWTLGELGRLQKERTGGLKAEILIALLKLLKEKNKEVFEEAASALKKIQMPEFIHSLYLYHVGAINLLNLKSAVIGLNELSITLNYLLDRQKRVVMAITGDSGTGKTYFCQALKRGCLGLKSEDILYLSRDSREGRKMFNRLLGRQWLQKYIDPIYYQYDVFDHDDQEAFWSKFQKNLDHYRLILLDGCRDRHYFQKIIDLFYERGELDLVVNFRTNFSTRRLNLESRERALESVKLHLSFLEEPSLEDTFFYQEGKIILYDLDNSISCRLSQEEISELFTPRSIKNWGELIQLGHFETESILPLKEDSLQIEKGQIFLEERPFAHFKHHSFNYQEKILAPHFNQQLAQEPHLLYTLFSEDLEPYELNIYAQEQIGGFDHKNQAFVLSLLDHHLFFVKINEKTGPHCLLNRKFYFQDEALGLTALSFEREEIIRFNQPQEPIMQMVPWPPFRLLIKLSPERFFLWDFEEKRIFELRTEEVFSNSIQFIAAEPANRLYLASQKEIIWIDVDKKENMKIKLQDDFIETMQYLPKRKWLAVVSNKERDKHGLKIIDCQAQKMFTLWLPGNEPIKAVDCLLDGRIVLARESLPQKENESLSSTLALLTPKDNSYHLAKINRQDCFINDILVLGPRIITCGLEKNGQFAFRIWGSQFFVKTELAKMKIKP